MAMGFSSPKPFPFVSVLMKPLVSLSNRSRRNQNGPLVVPAFFQSAESSNSSVTWFSSTVSYLIIQHTESGAHLFPCQRGTRGSLLPPSNALDQVGTVALGFLQRRSAPPLRHLRVIAANQHFRNAPAPIHRRPRIMRKIKQNVIRSR